MNQKQSLDKKDLSISSQVIDPVLKTTALETDPKITFLVLRITSLPAKSEMSQPEARYWQIDKYKGDWGLFMSVRCLP